MSKIIRIEFSTLNRTEWIRTIYESAQDVRLAKAGDSVSFEFNNIRIDEIEPIHLVTLACLIELFVRQGYDIFFFGDDTKIRDFLFETLQFHKYWQENQNYVPVGNTDAIFNLWRLVDSEKEGYSQMVHDYLQSRFFKSKDLSAVKNSLLEAYYNVSDHAEAMGVAFSFIKFDEITEKLYVAVCDFGKGIANTVRAKLPEITNDGAALQKAMEDLFTVGSQEHNRGLGLGNILRTCQDDDVLRILSNRGFLYAKNGVVQVQESNIPLDGTLIYYELSLSHFDDLEIIPNFEL